MTEDQIQSYFNSLGYDPVITYDEAPQVADVESKGTIGLGPFEIPYTMYSTNTTYASIPKIQSLTKIGGGRNSSPITHSPSSTGKGSGGKGGGGKGGKGGSGKGSTPKAPTAVNAKDLIEVDEDPYYEVNNQL